LTILVECPMNVFSPAIDPIAPWPAVALVAALVVGLTLLAYRRKLRGASGRWRWVALGLRLAAVALCVLAALRPSLLVLQKVKQTATVLFLTDVSASMGLGGEAGGKTRLEAARQTLETGLDALKGLGPDIVPKTLVFDGEVRELKPDERLEAKGRQTAVGTALDEAVRRYAATKILRVVLLGDGASNTGPDPVFIAETLRNQNIPVVTVGFGSESGGPENRDVAVRDLEAGPIVYARTQLEVFAKLDVRGYPNAELEVELRAEGKADPVARGRVTVPPNATELNVRGLKWTPETAGETKLELSVKPQRGEVLLTNNTSSTFVTVLKGGISVLYIQGPSSPWEKKYLVRALDASEKIQVQYVGLHEPARPDFDAELVPGKYDVIILGDLPAEFLSRDQHRLLAESVRRGAGLMMLGGRSSFGDGGWAGSEIADVLPVEIHPGDGQLEPEGGIKVVPNPLGLDSYVLRVASTRAESQRLWESLPPIGGANRFDEKRAARVWALSPQGDPLIVAQDVGKSRTLAFGGETWPWYRYSDESRLLHLNFWRNTILWLAHKEDEGENQVRIELDRRRVALGQKLDISATARDGRGQPIDGVEFKTTVTRIEPVGGQAEPLTLQRQGEGARGDFLATADPGTYKVEVTATKGSEPIGTASARFLVYDDDRELRRTAADLALLRAVAQASDGEYLAPEQLEAYLRKLDKEVVADYSTQNEVRLWDNWPFLLIFTALLTAEWWLRKRHGWV
jgi:uncharacterized membrane protein